MKTALITGVGGQDGSYLAEVLGDRGYRVVGIVRDSAKAAELRRSGIPSAIELAEWNLTNPDVFERLVAVFRPDEVYNCAAFSSGMGMYDEAAAIADVNGLAVTRMLDAIRRTHPTARFCQASSSEVFGLADESPQSETTRRNPRSPYGAAKMYADAIIRIYRERYSLFACSAILFNHESPRRRMEFVTRKITHAAASIKLGLSRELRLGNLEATRDWGFAGDYARAMWHMLQTEVADDYVVATGQSHSVREFCRLAFERVGLDYRKYVTADPAFSRPPEAQPLLGDANKARQILGWKAETQFHEIVHLMVDADLALLQR